MFKQEGVSLKLLGTHKISYAVALDFFLLELRNQS